MLIIMKIPRCLNMTPCKLVYRHRRFGGTCCLHLHSSQRRISALEPRWTTPGARCQGAEWAPGCFVGSGKGVPCACPDTTPKPSSSSQQLSNLPTEISQVQCSMYVYIE